MYLTVKDVTERLQISRAKLSYMRERGDFITPMRWGRSIRFCSTALDDWLSQRTSK